MTQKRLEKIAELRRISEENKGALARAMSRLVSPEAQVRAAERQRILYGHDDKAICDLIIDEVLGLVGGFAQHGGRSVKWMWTSSDIALQVVRDEMIALGLHVQVSFSTYHQPHKDFCADKSCRLLLYSFTLHVSW